MRRNARAPDWCTRRRARVVAFSESEKLTTGGAVRFVRSGRPFRRMDAAESLHGCIHGVSDTADNR
jgi:hypothetical protein